MPIASLVVWGLMVLFSSASSWAAPPAKSELISIAPFEDVGPMPSLLFSAASMQSAMAAHLDERHKLKTVRLSNPVTETARSALNAQLIPPSMRHESLSIASRKPNWLLLARQNKSSILLQGTFEQFGGELRMTAEALEPYTGSQIFHQIIEGPTAEQQELESALADEIATRILEIKEMKGGQAVPIKKDPVAPETVAPATETLTPDEHYENGFALTRRYDQTSDMKYLDGAIEEYRAALGIDPKHFRSLNNLGTVLHRKGNYEEALGYYQKVLELNPKYARAMENAAIAYNSLGRTEDAARMWEKALEFEDRPEVKAQIQATLEKIKAEKK